MTILIGILTFVLILISLFMILVVLAQKAKDGGVGAAMGGGAAEAAFGAETGNVLSKATINAAIAFFALTFALYLGHIYQRKHLSTSPEGALPTISVPAAVTPIPGVPSLPATSPEASAPKATSPETVTPPAASPATPDQPKKSP